MVGEVYLESVYKRFGEYKKLAEKAMEQLSEEELLLQTNEESNSIAIIIQHLHGNMLSRWTNFLTEDGEKEWRKRDEEFEAVPFARDEMMRRWEEGWKVLLQAIKSLSADDLLKHVTIRTQSHTVIDAINRQMAHYGYHVGQIVYLSKWVRNGEWKTLSISKGKSETFNNEMKSSHG